MRTNALHDSDASSEPVKPTKLQRDALLAQAVLIKAARSIGDADVYRADPPGSPPLLIKSYHQRPLMIRWLFARRCLRNEYRKLTLLHELNIVRVPRPIALLAKDSLLMEFLEDASALNDNEQTDKEPTREFIARLGDALQELHRRGIAHGDFRSTNVLILPNEQPCLIDFATAVTTLPGGSRLERLLFPFFMRIDHIAMAKIIAKFYPDMLSVEQSQSLRQPPWYLRIGRFLRANVYRRYIKQSNES
jgi:serine/threonine protein kinase